MFQRFDGVEVSSSRSDRVGSLRRLLAEHDLDGFLVPRADEHQGEYVPACSERLRWLTGFSGSAGTALILRDRALLFVDGRYLLQGRQQTDPELFEIVSSVETAPGQWMAANVASGSRIGFDPWLHTVGQVREFNQAGEKAGIDFVPVSNLVDAIWTDRPEPPLEPVRIHPVELAGELARDKLSRLSEHVAAEGAQACILSDPSSLAWAFNIRGGDVPHTPLALGYAILKAEGLPQLFLDRRKLGIEARAYLTQLADLHAPVELEEAIAALGRSRASVLLDPALASEKLRMLVEENGGTVVLGADPARLPRATKNAAEIAGTRSAHRRDGAALARFLHWLDGQEPGSVDEIAAVTELEEMRRRTGEELQMPLRDISFDTIAGSGPNGAIIHYHVSQESNRRLGEGELFLLDSGGQYEDGTTDVTRTVPVGTPTDEMRRCFTLVLKGMIGISALRFPAGTRGCDIDAVARTALWKAGLDYLHGTGHGVGSYLSVHEGPQRIARTGTQKLLAGMILSNEPGCYREGEYGIRIENLILVTPEEALPGGDIPMHGFETLTLVPIDRRLVVTEMLTAEELAWMDDYHARVLREIGPLLEGEALAWLERATAPLS